MGSGTISDATPEMAISDMTPEMGSGTISETAPAEMVPDPISGGHCSELKTVSTYPPRLVH